MPKFQDKLEKTEKITLKKYKQLKNGQNEVVPQLTEGHCSRIL